MLGQTDVQVALIISVLVLAPAAWFAARWLGWARPRPRFAALAGVCLALVPATTLASTDRSLDVDWERSCYFDPGATLISAEALLNIALFAPAAFFAVLAVQRLKPVVIGTLVGSLAIEVIQLASGLGRCEGADVLRNTLGAVAFGAVGMGFIVLAERRRSGAADSKAHQRAP